MYGCDRRNNAREDMPRGRYGMNVKTIDLTAATLYLYYFKIFPSAHVSCLIDSEDAFMFLKKGQSS